MNELDEKGGWKVKKSRPPRGILDAIITREVQAQSSGSVPELPRP